MTNPLSVSNALQFTNIIAGVHVPRIWGSRRHVCRCPHILRALCSTFPLPCRQRAA